MTAASAFLWGVACVFVPVRRLLAIAGVFLVVAALLVGRSDGGFVLLGVARGAMVTLPWVFAAERLGVQRLATLGIGLAFFGAIMAVPGPVLAGWLLDIEADGTLRFGVAGLGGLLAAVAYILPSVWRVQVEEPA